MDIINPIVTRAFYHIRTVLMDGLSESLAIALVGLSGLTFIVTRKFWVNKLSRNSIITGT